MAIMQRALITGITGFTGHYVASELMNAGYEVHGLGERASSLARYHRVNINDKTALHTVIALIRPDVVVHLAGLAAVAGNATDDFYCVHLLGTKNLLEAIAAEAPLVKCVLLASSANVYGNAIEGVLYESTRPNPANDYAVSKLAMEYMARLWFDRLPIVIARPFNYTGVGQSEAFILPKIIGHFKRGATFIELGNLAVFRDFGDVRAVANAYRRLIEVCPAGEVVNVCSGRSHSLEEVLNMVGKIMGYEMDVRVNSAFVRQHEVRSLLGSAEHLRSLIGAWASPPLLETLSWMCQEPCS